MRDGRCVAASVVVEDDHDTSARMTEVVEGLVGHAPGQCTVPDHSDDALVTTSTGELMAELIGRGEAVGVGEHGRGVAVLDPVVLGLSPTGVAGKPTSLPKLLKPIAAARQELV